MTETENFNFDYWKVPKYIPDHVCDVLLSNYTNWQTGKINSGRGGEEVTSRSSDVIWIKEEFWLSTFFKIMSDINGWSGLNFDITGVQDLQLTRYVAPAGHYDFHIDGNGYTRPPNNNLVRKLSASVLLTDPKNFEGGEFEFKFGNNSTDFTVDMDKGDIILFPSYILHRVRPVTKGTRYSLVIWACGKPLR